MHDNAYSSGRSENNIKCVVHGLERTEQLDIFCRIAGFTSDFLSFIDVELIRFFHRALQVFYGERMISQLQHNKNHNNQTSIALAHSKW